MCNTTSWNVETNLNHCLLELVTVLCCFDRFSICANELWRTGHTNKSLCVESHRQVETCLPSQSGKNCIRFFALDDLGKNFWSQRLDIRTIGEVRVRHDGGRVRVGEHHAIPLRLQHTTCLSAGVVEFTRLTNNDGTRPNDEDVVDVITAWHYLPSIISANCAKR
ncbi:unannotated protein [freshwater metagenome]|uniref:Unannotated protein n=1 Tax=freshwater metagenome TaxID=449393 RepID=A0A6J6HBL7_9ZZZZ